jgi:hypothetical protein
VSEHIPDSSMRIGLVGCVETKLTHRAEARDLYVSQLFAERRRYFERSCGDWFIFSAKHGLVRTNQELDPYDETLVGKARREKRPGHTGYSANLRPSSVAPWMG